LVRQRSSLPLPHGPGHSMIRRAHSLTDLTS